MMRESQSSGGKKRCCMSPMVQQKELLCQISELFPFEQRCLLSTQ